MKRALLLSLVALALVACANRPESIHPSFVSYEKFVPLDCAALASRISGARAELERVSKMQDEKATGDAVGVFLLGIPFSKLTGDYEGEVARLKGEVEAIETAQVKNGCELPPPVASSPPPSPKTPPRGSQGGASGPVFRQ
jgi:hypothetical protein